MIRNTLFNKLIAIDIKLKIERNEIDILIDLES